MVEEHGRSHYSLRLSLVEPTDAKVERSSQVSFPDDGAAKLDAWERKLNGHRIDDADRSAEDAFRVSCQWRREMPRDG
jgi:hypothetical protein